VRGGVAGDVSTIGVGLALVSGAGYAGYAVATKRMLSAGNAPEMVMAAVFGTGAVMLLPVLGLAPAGGLLAPDGVALALYLGAIPTALAYVLFARGLRRIGAGETATLTLAEPLTAAALGVIVLGERPGATAVAGAALVLAGLALLALRPVTAANQPRPAHA
jgi:DME family drug/metabolite transporter